jgi:hypothetical protein
MSGEPHFPDLLGRRELLRPGATQHKAGPTIEERIAALERGAISRPPKGTANGCVNTSDNTQTSGVKWVRESFVGRSTQTTTGSTGSLGNGGVSGTGFTPQLIVAGDSTNYLRLRAQGYAPYISAGTAGHFNVAIYDVGAAATIAKQQFYVPSTGVSAGGISIEAFVAPYSGNKTFILVFENSTGGTATFQNQAATNFPTYLTADWTGSANHA